MRCQRRQLSNRLHHHTAATLLAATPSHLNSVSGPDLPSPCSLIFSLSPYSTFLPAPNIPNPPITHRPRLLPPFILPTPPPELPWQHSCSPVLSCLYVNWQGGVAEWQDKTRDLEKNRKREKEEEGNACSILVSTSQWMRSKVWKRKHGLLLSCNPVTVSFI